MSELRSQSQAVAVGSATSKHRQHQQHCRTTSLTSVAATVWQAVCARPSACRASRHAAWMQVSAVRQWEHACASAAAVLALGVAAQPGVHPRGTVSVPRWRSTSAAISQQPVGLFRPDKVSSRLRDQGSMAMAVSASDASMRDFLWHSPLSVGLRLPHAMDPGPRLEALAASYSPMLVREARTLMHCYM